MSILNKILNVEYFVPKKLIPKSGRIKNIEIVKLERSLVLKSKMNKNLILPRYLYLEEIDLTAIGLYFAEGTKYVNLHKHYHHSGEVGFVIDDVNCIKQVIALFEKLWISKELLRWRIDLNIKYTLNENLLSEYWIKQVGIKEENKRPRWVYRTGTKLNQTRNKSKEFGALHIFYSSTIFRNVFLNFIESIWYYCIDNNLKKELALILQGFFAGDGSVNYCPKYNRKQVDFCNNDLKLIEKLRKSLKILGLKSIKETWPEKTKTNSKSLRIYNLHDFKILDKYKILELMDYKKKTFKRILDSY